MNAYSNPKIPKIIVTFGRLLINLQFIQFYFNLENNVAPLRLFWMLHDRGSSLRNSENIIHNYDNNSLISDSASENVSFEVRQNH